MKTQPITDLAVRFLKIHWNDINHAKLEMIGTEEDWINLVKKEYSDACWVITEVMSRGCNINYLKPLMVDCESHLVIKISGKYFKWSRESNFFEFVEPKFKTVIYFD